MALFFAIYLVIIYHSNYIGIRHYLSAMVVNLGHFWVTLN